MDHAVAVPHDRWWRTSNRFIDANRDCCRGRGNPLQIISSITYDQFDGSEVTRLTVDSSDPIEMAGDH